MDKIENDSEKESEKNIQKNNKKSKHLCPLLKLFFKKGPNYSKDYRKKQTLVRKDSILRETPGHGRLIHSEKINSPKGSQLSLNVLSLIETNLERPSSHQILPLNQSKPGTEEEEEAEIQQPLIGTIHTQVDYVHFLVPDLTKIINSNYYWGIMDRYEAERLLNGRPEGTFLLRDSAQEDFLFSVSFRRYNRSLHARIEQMNHVFSFDSHDVGVFSCKTVSGLIEHYKDPSYCLFFEPMLTIPLAKTSPFSLQSLCRAVICDNVTYDKISSLPIPKRLMQFLQYYHYKQKVRVRRF